MADPLSATLKAQAIEKLGLFSFCRSLVLPLILPLGNLLAGIGTELPSRGTRLAAERHANPEHGVQPE